MPRAQQMIAIRPYSAQQLDAVIDVFERSVRQIASRDYTPAQIAAWAPAQADRATWAARLSGDGVLVAELDGEIAGFASIDRQGHIDLFFVHPGFRRQGVARSLYEHVACWAMERGIAHLSADVSITARPFFERAGFRVQKSQEVERHGELLRNFFMERALEATAANRLGTRKKPRFGGTS